MPPQPLTVDCAGETLLLHPERALEWPARSTLFVADPHFGKDAHFRAAGIALPEGTLAEDLARLDIVLARTGATRLVILGDVVHARPLRAADWVDRVGVWRSRHADFEWLAVAGNHDTRFAPPADWRIDWRADPVVEAPFVFMHEPTRHPAGRVLAGHWHPVARLRQGRDSLRLPVFAFGPDAVVLPAFGGLTGGAPVDDPALHCYAAVEDRVIELPSAVTVPPATEYPRK
ncbi:MAG: ligase-associated DNA damage response endonuclease PdeM [Halofilum sp. (in: g-proteobacteria)]